MPQTVFHNRPVEEVFRADVPRAIVPALVFRFNPDGGRRFRALENQIWEERRANLLRTRGIAILIGDSILSTPHLSAPRRDEEAIVVRSIEFPNRTFDELVYQLRSLMKCTAQD